MFYFLGSRIDCSSSIHICQRALNQCENVANHLAQSYTWYWSIYPNRCNPHMHCANSTALKETTTNPRTASDGAVALDRLRLAQPPRRRTALRGQARHLRSTKAANSTVARSNGVEPTHTRMLHVVLREGEKIIMDVREKSDFDRFPWGLSTSAGHGHPSPVFANHLSIPNAARRNVGEKESHAHMLCCLWRNLRSQLIVVHGHSSPSRW